MKTALLSPKTTYFLLLIAAVLWLYSFAKSATQSQNITQLEEIWVNNLPKANKTIAKSQLKTQMRVTFAIIKRPDDQPILANIDSLLIFQNQTIQSLEKPQLASYQLQEEIEKFNSKYQNLLHNLSKKYPIIQSEEINTITKEFRNYDYFESPTNNSFLQQQLAQNYIYRTTNGTINYLANKVGGTIMHCGYRRIEPQIRFNSTLRKGKNSEGKLFLKTFYSPCAGSSSNNSYSKQMKINDQYYDIKGSGFQRITKVFSDTSPQHFKIEQEVYKHKIRNDKIIIDTVKIQETFVIYPQIKK